jgi:uncharacterized protein YuzE
MPVRAEYDKYAGALYIYLNDAEVATTEDREAEAYAVDLAADGTVVGIEMLNLARAPRLGALAEEWGFEDRLEELRDAFPTPVTFTSNSISATTSMVMVGMAASAGVAAGQAVTVASQSLSMGDPSRQQREPELV